MALTIEFSRRSTNQLQKILTFYDERNGSDTFSRQLMQHLLEDLQRLAQIPTASSPSTRPDVRFFYLVSVGRTEMCCPTLFHLKSIQVYSFQKLLLSKTKE